MSYQRLYKCRNKWVWWLDLGDHSRPRCILWISFLCFMESQRNHFSQKLQKQWIGCVLFWFQEELVASYCPRKRGYSCEKPWRICDLLRFHICWEPKRPFSGVLIHVANGPSLVLFFKTVTKKTVCLPMIFSLHELIAWRKKQKEGKTKEKELERYILFCKWVAYFCHR